VTAPRDETDGDELGELGEFDELRELRGAWRALEPPAATAPIDEPDPATRATVEWLRAAWRASEPAAPQIWSLPWSLRMRLRLRRARLAPIAAAAALVVAIAAGAGVWSSHVAESRRLETPRADDVAPSLSLVPSYVTPDRMELRSGAVRLILLTPSSESDR
jgi:hypothetical protein